MSLFTLNTLIDTKILLGCLVYFGHKSYKACDFNVLTRLLQGEEKKQLEFSFLLLEKKKNKTVSVHR